MGLRVVRRCLSAAWLKKGGRSGGRPWRREAAYDALGRFFVRRRVNDQQPGGLIAGDREHVRDIGRKITAVASHHIGRFVADLGARGAGQQVADLRSEEHTSELQSLMRISYAVFCLKKKKNDIED